jgi:GT2 family glycosyltransferase
MLKLYWQGYGGSKYLAEDLRPIINKLGMSLITISEWEDSDIKWNRNTWLNELKKADIIILPTDFEKRPCKSNNRLTQYMSLGKPVIVSPLPAYLRIIEKYPNCCLIATTKEEWEERLQQLRDNENLRNTLSQNGLIASKEFSLDEITKKWVLLFSNLEKTDIIIPTYNNLSCLKQCLDSIRVCTTSLYNIIIVDNGSNLDVQKYLESQVDIVYIKKDRMNFAQAINTGLKVSTSKYVCILNDDVIVSKNWLEKMIETCKDGIGAVGLLSNCDKSWLHNYDINIGGINLLPGIHRECEIKPIIPAIYSYVSPFNEIREQNWVAFYCTLIPRETIQKVGLLDEQSFSNSGEDVDYCYRIKKMGYKIIQNFNSFVFHYGAVARHIVEKEDPEKYHELDEKNKVHLNEKWNKKTICIYSGSSWERWNYNSCETSGIGGSETHQIKLSEEFAKLGFRVISFADCSIEGKFNGVNWLHYTKFNEFIEYYT